MDDISEKRSHIYHDFHDVFFEELSKELMFENLDLIIRDMIYEYDKFFLNGDVFKKLKQEDIRLKVFITKDDVVTRNRLSSVDYSYDSYYLTFNIELILKYNPENLKNLDYLETFMLIVEHEFIHLILWLWDYTEDKRKEEIFRDHGKFFKCVAETIFGHQDIEHDLGYKNMECDNDYLEYLSPKMSKMLTNAVIKKDIFSNYIDSEILKKQEHYLRKLKQQGYTGISIIGIPENRSHRIISELCKKYDLECIVFIDKKDKDIILPTQEKHVKKYIVDVRGKDKVQILESDAESFASHSKRKISYIQIGLYDEKFNNFFKPDVRYRHVDVLLDSELQYGSKIRGAKFFYDIKRQGYSEIVVAGSAEGYAQVTGPFCCNEVGLKCTIFIKKLDFRTEATKKGLELGANIIEIPNARMRDLDNMAKEYASKKPNEIKYVQIGLFDDKFIDAIANNVVCLKEKYKLQPSELWIVAGTGTIAAGISRAFPFVPVNLVKVGLDIWEENINFIEKSSSQKPIIHVAPFKFHQHSSERSPYKAHPNYDDKIWYFAKKLAKDDALIWIIA